MGLVHAYKKGEVPASKVSQAVKDAAKSMKKSSVKKYAKTKHDDLPLKKEERDYKDEYKKFQSSTKSKKYRAELNKYNRKKGTYGNGDGKDASHKGGKIVGFEKESKNRGRAEKSRLKKENSMNKLNEEQYFNPNGEFKKYMDKVFKQAGIKVIKFDPMKQSFWNGTWGGFYTVKSSNKVDMKGQGKVKRGSTVLPVYISRVGEIALGVSGGGFHPGKVGSSQVLKNLKDFKKSDLDESVEESVDENLLKQIKQAEKIAKSMSGNMTGAVKGIEKIRRGLSHHKRVKVALKKANEGLGDKFSKKISKHGGTRNKAEVGNILKYLIKKGDNKKDALDKIKQNYDYVSKKYRSASVSKKADILTSLQESITEGIFGKFDTGAGFKGNGMTVYDRNQEKAGDYKDIAHIAPNGKITIYDKKVKKEPKLMQSLNKISQEFKKTFKESVNEACWVGYKQVGMKDKNGKKVPNCVKEIYEIFYEEGGKGHGYTFEHIKDLSLTEAEYQGRKVKLGKIMQGDQKKFKVYVKNPKGNTVKVNFGQGGDAKGGTMRIRKSNPKARASFRARHNCDSPGPRHKARYWSCRKW